MRFVSLWGGKMIRCAFVKIFLPLSILAIFCLCAVGQSQIPATGTEVWPEVDAHVQLSQNIRLLSYAGVQQGVGFPYQQWYTAAGLGYQFKPILKSHLENIDPDKEHHLVVGGGYEFFQTIQSGKTKDENRLILEAIPGFRPPAGFLVRDTNRVEFRWVNGVYSTRYRNKLDVERDFLLHGFRFTPYGFAEVFYNGAKNSWDQEWYAAGIQWPYKRLLMVDTYYLLQKCPTCTPANANVAGVTLNFYLRNTK
jgi:Protein of unknown function (DUF2490)